jgi:hypothetical protein
MDRDTGTYGVHACARDCTPTLRFCIGFMHGAKCLRMLPDGALTSAMQRDTIHADWRIGGAFWRHTAPGIWKREKQVNAKQRR